VPVRRRDIGEGKAACERTLELHSDLGEIGRETVGRIHCGVAVRGFGARLRFNPERIGSVGPEAEDDDRMLEILLPGCRSGVSPSNGLVAHANSVAGSGIEGDLGGEGQIGKGPDCVYGGGFRGRRVWGSDVCASAAKY